MDLEALKAKFSDGVWLVDSEYATPPGDQVIPVCVVGREFFTGRGIQVWINDSSEHPTKRYDNPFPVDSRALFVAYAAHSEWNCFLSLGWCLPRYVLDLHTEYLNEISGRTPPPFHKKVGRKLQHAMEYFGLDGIDAVEKKERQQRIARGFPFTATEQADVLEYCKKDVLCLEKLLPAMAPTIELEYAILRGQYSKAVARIERVGIPVDRRTYERLICNREGLKSRLIDNFEAKYGPSPHTLDKRGEIHFSFQKLSTYLDVFNLLPEWPRTPKGRLMTAEDCLEKMARQHPDLQPLADLIKRIKDLRQFGLEIGLDDRSRFPVMPFATISGRNAPPASRFLLAQSAWTRGLIKPRPREFLANVDWSAAEFAIAAVLSEDKAMIDAYASGDPYTQAAIDFGFAPPGATKHSHGSVRDLMKIWVLAAQYGATPKALVEALPFSLSKKMSNPLAVANLF
jgi:DNA polymerase-1